MPTMPASPETFRTLAKKGSVSFFERWNACVTRNCRNGLMRFVHVALTPTFDPLLRSVKPKSDEVCEDVRLYEVVPVS